MSTLSLCMIVKDEAANLPLSLASAKDLADEIIVIDTGSSDDTPTIAEKAGAKVDFFTWNNNFADARNVSLDKATMDWVLVLDADETLTTAGRSLIQTLKGDKPLGSVAPSDILFVAMVRKEISANQSPYSQVSRLFRNLEAIRFTRPYHESVDDSVEALMAKEKRWQAVKLGEVAIAHTGYSIDEITAKDKLARAQRIMESHLEENPQDAYIANKLGALYTQKNEWEKALKMLRKALASGNFDPMTEYELYYHLGIAHRNLVPIAGQMQAAEEAYQKAIAIPIADKLKLGAYLNLGALLKLKGDLDGAQAQYETAARVDPKEPTIYYNLGVVHRARGYLEPALRAYEYAIALDPNYAAAHQNLGVVLFKLGKLPQSKRAFDRAIALMEKSDPVGCDRLRKGVKDLGLDKIVS